MPRGNAAVWQHYGPSYAQLTARDEPATKTSQPEHQHVAAGNPSTMLPRGPGTFTAQQTWSLSTMPNCKLQRATETSSSYQPAPADYKRQEPMRNNKSDFPVPNYPHEFKTVTQAHFTWDRSGFQKAQAIRPPASSTILAVDCQQPQFTTQFQADYAADCSRAGGQQQSRAGHAATQQPGFNIITGGNALSNNGFEYWDGRDYRRHR